MLAEGDAELVQGMERIACPTLVMAGLIPGARLVILPGLRHMALAEAPAAVNMPLCAFLRAKNS